MELVPDIDRLTQIFSNAVAPSFFLGAIAAFVSLMMSQLAAVNAHIKATRALPDQDRSAVGSSMALRPLTRRARLLNDGIILSLGGGVCATDRCAYRIDLALGMRARIARIGNEIAQRPVGDGQPRRLYRRY